MKKGRLFKETALYTLGEILPRLVAFILLPIFTAYLSTSDYGIINYTNTVMMVVFVFATLSLNTYILRTFYEQKTEEDKKKLIGNMFLFILLSNFVLMVLQYFILPIVLDALKVKIAFHPYFEIAIINNFVDVLAIIPLAVYRVKQNASKFVQLNLSRTILQLLLIYILIVHFKWGLMGNFYGRLYINLAFTAVFFVVVSKNAFFKINIPQIKDALKFSLPLLPGTISYIAITSLDRIILERYVSLSSLGIYSVAYTLSLTLNIVIQGAYKAFEPVIFKAFDTDDFENVTGRIQSYFYYTVLVAGLGLSLFSKEVFLIMASHNFFDGYKVVPIIVLGVVISGFNLFLSTMLIAYKKQKHITYAMVCSAVISIAFNFILIPRFGYFGAAMSSVSAFLFTAIYYQTKIKVNKKFIILQLAAIGFAVAIAAVFFNLLKNNSVNIYEIFLKILVSLVYMVIIALWFFPDLIKSKLKKLREMRS